MTAGAKILNLSIELSGVILCAMGILLVVFSKVDQRTRRYFVPFYSGLIVLAASNMAGLLMRGLPGPGWRVALSVSNFTEFLMPTVLTYIITQYLLSIIDPGREKRRLRIFLLALLVLDVIGLTVSQFIGFYYILDENNVYQRSAAYPLSYLMTAIMLCIDIGLLLRHKNAPVGKERTAFWIYFIVPTISIVLQNIQYGINFTIFSTIVAGLALYIFVVKEQTDRYYRQELENAQLRTDIMLSQIQPHFLHNALGAIEELCESDPKAAKAATVNFSRYLRRNMDSITEHNAIPFQRELEHTKIYLEMEKARFEDALRVCYDIQCTGFQLPTLTLQPIVENAVYHGARGEEKDVGTVTVATREYPDHYEAIVTDDGPGFDPSAPPAHRKDGRSHVGIQNVRERLRRISGGELRIESEIGRGTTATIIIPKRAEQ